MVKIWRGSAGLLLVCYLLLAFAGAVLAAWAGAAPGQVAVPAVQLPPLLLVAFLTWRVSRGGWLSRGILLFLNGFTFVSLAVSRGWGLPVLAVLAIQLSQIALLRSPAVSQRAARDRRPAAWPRLSAWVLGGGLLAGIVITLLFLGNMGPTGCSASGYGPAITHPPACTEISEGYPVRFLTGEVFYEQDGRPGSISGLGLTGVPLISVPGLLRDWAQWSVVSLSVLYGLQCWFSPPPRRPASEASDEATDGQTIAAT